MNALTTAATTVEGQLLLPATLDAQAMAYMNFAREEHRKLESLVRRLIIPALGGYSNPLAEELDRHLEQTRTFSGNFCWKAPSLGRLPRSCWPRRRCMNMITTTGTATMSSQEVADLVCSRHDDVKRSIARLAGRGVIQLPPMAEVKNHLGQAVSVYQICKRDSFVVVAQLSPEFTAALVDRWQELEEKVARPMTQAELIAASANHLVAIERRQAEQHAALASVEARTNQLEQIRYLDSVPSGFESITTIRDRTNKRLGLPAWVINAVMREVSGAPLPFAMVRSKHAEDGGQPFAIWPKPAITRRFDRFIEECTMVTPERATHPEITGGRFKVKPL